MVEFMERVTPKPKEIAKKRLAIHPIMKIPLQERNSIINKENINPEVTLKKSSFRKKDREIENCGLRNPFDIPQKDRIFSKSKPPKKRRPQPTLDQTQSNIATICDVDNTFYKVIEGRPLRRSDDIKVYMSNIRDILLFKANAAFMRDQVLQIDASQAYEETEYNKIVGLFKSCKKAFAQYARSNYNESKKIQMLAAVRTLELERKSEELSVVCDAYVLLRNRLSDIALNFANLSRYRNFLDTITPIWWRMENNGSNDTFFDLIAESPKLSPQISLLSGGSLQINRSIIDKIKKIDSTPYFVDPIQICDIFENLRMQCLNYLDIAGYSANIVSRVSKARDCFKKQVEAETYEYQSYIDLYNSLIKFEEEKAEAYKNRFHRILSHEFQELFASFDTSKLFTCVQYVSTKVLKTTEDPNDDIAALMFNLEKHYMELLLQLDSLDVDVVKKATKHAFMEDNKKMTRAYKAQRTIKECDILRKSLYNSFEPSRANRVKNITEKE